MADNKYNFYQTNWNRMNVKCPAKRIVAKAIIKYIKEMVHQYGWEETEKRLKEKNYN